MCISCLLAIAAHGPKTTVEAKETTFHVPRATENFGGNCIKYGEKD